MFFTAERKGIGKRLRHPVPSSFLSGKCRRKPEKEPAGARKHAADANCRPAGVRLRAFLTALCLLFLALLSSCGNAQQKNETEEVPYSAGQMALVSASAKKETEEIYTDRIWSVPTNGRGTFADAYTEELREFFIEMTAMNRMAEESGTHLEQEERNRLEEAAASFYTSSVEGAEQFSDLTKEETQEMFLVYALAVKLRDSIAADRRAEVSEDEARVIRVQELRFDSEEAAAKAAQEIADGTDFSKAGTDAGATENISRKLMRGELLKESEDAVFALETNGVSGVLEEEGAYCIYLCVNSYDEEETAAHRLLMERERSGELLREAYENYRSGHEIVMDSGTWEEAVRAADVPYEGENFFEAVKGAQSGEGV